MENLEVEKRAHDLDSSSSSGDSDNFEDARNTMDFEEQGPVPSAENTDFAGSDPDSEGENHDLAADTDSGVCPMYVEQFDEHVRGVFALDYMIGQSRMLRNYHVLQPSINNSSGSYYIPRPRWPFRLSGQPTVEHLYLDPDVYAYNEVNPEFPPETQQEINEIKQIPGTLWSSSEKDTFFLCLARYLIHRLDEFLPHLPYKTRAEIEAYYHLLKGSLESMKRVKNYNAFLYGEAKHRLRTKYSMRVWEDGIRYWRIPIAHEVDEEWVQFEERQSQLLAERDLRIANAVSLKKAQILAKYIDHSLNLVDSKGLNELAQIYNANGITPPLEGQKSAQVDLWSLVFLDELVKTRLRDIFLAILTDKGTNSVNMGPDSDDESELSLTPAMQEKIVTTEDVWKAASDLRLFETRKSGFKSRYIDGKTPLLATYWARIAESLQLSLTSDLETDEAPVPGPIVPLESEYTNLDYFLRPITPQNDEIELPDGLVAATAPEVSVSESDDEILISSSSDEGLIVPHSWNLAAPWDTKKLDSMDSDSSDSDADGQNSLQIVENRALMDNPNPGISSKVFLFSDLETSKTFARKRTVDDVKIEDYLNEDVNEYIEWRDRKMNHAYLRELRALAGLPVERQNLREPRRNCISRSLVHRAWVKHFASY